MVKNFIKELIITLLIAIAIILVLAIFLYDYVPTTKTLPNKVTYTTPEEAKADIENENSMKENIDLPQTEYKIDADDLNNYKRVEDYRPGKANPFSSYLETNTSPGTTPSTGNESGNGNGNQNNNNNNKPSTGAQTSSGGSYFPNKGTK